MAYLSQIQLESMGFKKLGKDVKVSDKASIYNADQIELGDHARIDDFCSISGRVTIGRFNHITPMCLIAGGLRGVVLDEFCTLAYGVKVFAQSDDYSGATLANSLIPKKFKNEFFAAVSLERHVIVGTNAVIFPGVTLAEGCAVGAMSLVTKSTVPWGIYTGIPAKRIKERSRELLKRESEFLEEYMNDSV
ncbi:dTDP-4-amino-4,6-dideoxy-D-glucose acyltransferase [compost metagenome]